MSTFAYVNTYAYSVTHLTDNMLRGLQELIRELGLSPQKFADDWRSSELAISTWLGSGQLYKLALEIYDPSEPDEAILIPEFDIVYDTDSDDDGRKLPSARPWTISCGVNQRASSSSLSRIAMSREVAVAMKPTINEAGIGQGCDEW